jgi:predicted nucleic acid-binding protein
MIILDTNVVSEPLKPNPDQTVLRWLDAQEPQTLHLTSVGLAELLAGVEVLPAGRRRDALAEAVSKQVLALFAQRILPLDVEAAQAFAKTRASAQAQGNPIGFADCAIAAIARSRGFALATRNVRDFAGCGINLINPWTPVRRVHTALAPVLWQCAVSDTRRQAQVSMPAEINQGKQG